MQKYRIYELAKIYNKGNDEIIAVLNKNNIEVNQINFFFYIFYDIFILGMVKI